MARWVERIVLTFLGALVGAGLVAGAEARTAVAAAGGHPPALPHLVVAEWGVLVPLALAVGAVVAAVSLFLEPERPLSPSERIALVRSESVLARSRIAALAPLAILAGTAWVVAVAQVGRSLLAAASPMAAGVALAVSALALLLAVAAVVLSALAPLRRRLASTASHWPSAIDPVTTGAIALAAALLVFVVGMGLGDTGGEGPTPLAIFGVLKRHELDLRPLVDLVAILTCAWLAPIAGSGPRPRPTRILFGLVVIAGALAVTASQAVDLERDVTLAQVIESYAPLGRIALALDRKATDRDGDGASPYFGGGDCNDHDPSISPTAMDIPGNGIDEDCSGADAPRPTPPHSPAPAAHATAHVDRDLNLIFLTVDTLRASEMSFLGYDKPTTPNLDALARDSVVFDDAYSMASYTGKALAPMLIGKYPSETLRDGGHFNKYFQGNTFVAERLHSAGVFTMGAASHWYFREQSGLTQGCDIFDLSAMPKSGQTDTDTNSTSPQLTDAAIALLREHATGHRFFFWVHYFDPHAQYVPHEGAPDFSEPEKKPGSSHMRALYDGEVWFTDQAIGRLLEFVKSQPWGADTAIVMTSDHGEAMGEHGIAFQHGFELWEPLMRVPLLVHVPGVPPHHVPVKRSVIDLVPTILDVMRVPQPAPGELSGQSAIADLFSTGRAGEGFEERDVYMDMPDGPYTHLRRALVHGTTPGMKLIHFGGRHYQLFDLANDPGELDDLSGDSDRLRPMIEAMQAKRATLHEVFVKPDAPALP